METPIEQEVEFARLTANSIDAWVGWEDWDQLEDSPIILDGKFTVGQLEAIATLLRARLTQTVLNRSIQGIG